MKKILFFVLNFAFCHLLFAEKIKIGKCEADQYGNNQKAKAIELFFDTTTKLGEIYFIMNEENDDYDGIPLVSVKNAEVLTTLITDHAEALELIYAFKYKGAQQYDFALYNRVYDNGGESFYGAMLCTPTKIAPFIDFAKGTVQKTKVKKFSGYDSFFTSEEIEGASLGSMVGNYQSNKGLLFPKFVTEKCTLETKSNGKNIFLDFSINKKSYKFEFENFKEEIQKIEFYDGLILKSERYQANFYFYYSLTRQKAVLGGVNVYNVKKEGSKPVVGCNNLIQ